MCEICEMKEIYVPAEYIDKRLRALADMWAVGWGEFGIKGDSVLELLRIAFVDTVKVLPLKDGMPTGYLFKGNYIKSHPYRTVKKAYEKGIAVGRAAKEQFTA